LVRKRYAMIASCEQQLKRLANALATCRQGRIYYPEYPEIQFHESVALHDIGELAAAIECLERLIAGSEARHFGSGARGLRGCIARSKLAGYLKEAGRLQDAMAQFRLALEKQLGYHPAFFGLGDLCVAERAWAGLDGIIAKLKMMPKVAVEAEVFRGRAHQARAEFAAARAVLEAAIQAYPLAFTPRLVLAGTGTARTRSQSPFFGSNRWRAKARHARLMAQPSTRRRKVLHQNRFSKGGCAKSIWHSPFLGGADTCSLA